MADTDQTVTVTITHMTITGKAPEVVAQVANEMRRLLHIDTNGIVMRPGEGPAAGD